MRNSSLTLAEALSSSADQSREMTGAFDVRILAEAKRTIKHLKTLRERPPCLVLLGEPNSGKTTIANALLAGGVLPADIIPNTRHATLVRYAASIDVKGHTADGQCLAIDNERDIKGRSIALLEIALPNQRLNDFELLDMPTGLDLNSMRHPTELTSIRIPIWCTSAIQAWKESERRAWTNLSPHLRRHGVLAVTRCDRIVQNEQRERIMTRLQIEAGPYFSKIIGTLDAAGRGHEFAHTIAGLAGSLRERRQRTIVRLCEQIAKLANKAILEQAMVDVDDQTLSEVRPGGRGQSTSGFARHIEVPSCETSATNKETF